ncbi:MAG: hypothetical protein PHT84_00975 [Candidatus Pacebacteria bacterium]|jgi:hypothetical protein|nr:hypothetical protein [Candidatus Paceibacterota bacterium]
MDFGFIPVAEASVMTLMKSINKVIINPIIFFLFALALVYFLYGVAQYLLNPDSEEIRKNSKSHMLHGVIGLFIMVAVFGIMNLILNTVGERKIKIENTGDYEITDSDGSGSFDTYSGSDPFQSDIGGGMVNPSGGVDFTSDPTNSYTPADGSSTVDGSTSVGGSSAIDGGYTSSSGNISTLQYVSTGPSLLSRTYSSDALFTRVQSSGVNPLLQLAREIAIKNAFLLVGIEIEDINTMTTVYPTASILEEKYIMNENTGNYEYWVAVEMEN